MMFRAILPYFSKLLFSAYCNRIPYNIPDLGGLITYFFLLVGIDFGGFFTKYCSNRL